MIWLLDLVPYLGVLVTLGFIIFRYARYNRWEDTDAGRAFMALAVSLLLLTLYVFATLVGLDGSARAVARFSVVGGIWAALTYLAVVMVRGQGGFRRAKRTSAERRDSGAKV